MKPLPTLAALCILAATTPSEVASALGDRRNGLFESAPPLPAQVKQTVYNRDPFSIILRVNGLQSEPATFILRGEAQHGKVRLVPQISREWAEVEYTPPKDRSIKEDSFRFVVSNSKGTSSESIAEIQFKDIGARLECPNRVDFGSLRVGDTRQRSIEVVNTGDAVATGTVALSGEWTWGESSPEYRIEPGQKASYRVQLTPSSAGKLEGTVRFGDTAQTLTFLQAKVSAWIGATPDPLLLTASLQKSRSADLVLFNETPLPEWVVLESTPELVHPYIALVHPDQSVRVPLVCTNPSPMEQFGKLVLSGTRDRQRVLLWRAAALGAELSGYEHLEKLVVSGSGKALRLWNEGGKTGRWILQTHAPFKVSIAGKDNQPGDSSSSELRLGPGEMAEAQISYEGKTPGSPGMLYLRTFRHPMMLGGTFKSIVLNALPLKTTPSAGPKAPGKAPTPEPLRVSSRLAFFERAASGAAGASSAPNTNIPFPPNNRSTASDSRNRVPAPEPVPSRTGSIVPKMNSGSTPSAAPDSQTMNEIQRAFLPGVILPGLEVRNITHHSAELRFPPPQGLKPEEILVQARQIDPSTSGSLRITWASLKSQASTTPNGKFSLAINNLPPGTSTGVRLLGPPIGNGRRVVLHQSDIQTANPPHWLSPSLPWIWLSGTGLAILLFLARRRGQPYARQRGR